jgi:RHS repeat-associated protein
MGISDLLQKNGHNNKEYFFNNQNQLESIEVSKESSPVLSYTYTLRPEGNRSRVTENTGKTVNWTYDNLYRLTSETVSGDPNSLNGYVGFTYDSVNRLTRSGTLAGISAYSVTHDPNDHRSDQTYNLNGAVTGANAHTFDYDAEDRLIGMDSGAVSVVYDGDGNLVQKTVGPEAYTYLIDTNSITGYAQILEIKRDGTLIDTFTYGANGIICQRNIPTAKVRYFGKDGSNSTRYLTDETGAITDTFDYSVDGILLDRTGTFPAVHLFQGEYYDSDLNLYWLRARWMNPQSGSFMSMDTFEGDFEEPLSLHKYGFVHWDGGVNLDDPSGQFTLLEGVMVAGMTSILSSMALSVHSAGLEVAAKTAWNAKLAWTQNKSKIKVSRKGNTVEGDYYGGQLDVEYKGIKKIYYGYSGKTLDIYSNEGIIPPGKWKVGSENKATAEEQKAGKVIIYIYPRSLLNKENQSVTQLDSVYSNRNFDAFQIHGAGISTGCIALFRNKDLKELMGTLEESKGGILDVKYKKFNW